jgi:hypothetical protein
VRCGAIVAEMRDERLTGHSGINYWSTGGCDSKLYYQVAILPISDIGRTLGPPRRTIDIAPFGR